MTKTKAEPFVIKLPAHVVKRISDAALRDALKAAQHVIVDAIRRELEEAMRMRVHNNMRTIAQAAARDYLATATPGPVDADRLRQLAAARMDTYLVEAIRTAAGAT